MNEYYNKPNQLPVTIDIYLNTNSVVLDEKKGTTIGFNSDSTEYTPTPYFKLSSGREKTKKSRRDILTQVRGV